MLKRFLPWFLLVLAAFGLGFAAAKYRWLEAPPDVTPDIVPATYSRTYVPEKFILNQSTQVFHYPECSVASKIRDDNRAEYIGTHEELVELGYTPCGICKP